MTSHTHVAGDIIDDRYEIKAFSNEGGMQEVYRAVDLRLKRVVALKVPKTKSATKRFARSARISAKVRHPNVANTLDYVEYDGRNYLIEEWVKGSDLRERLNEDFLYLDPHLAAHVFHHFVRGVCAAHHASVFHRDLKP